MNQWKTKAVDFLKEWQKIGDDESLKEDLLLSIVEHDLAILEEILNIAVANLGKDPE